MPTYVMQGPGGTRGAETGEVYSWDEGQEIEAPDGEFTHLSDSAYETRPASYQTRPMQPSLDASRKYEVNGAYKDFYVGGEKVAENVRCKREQAEAWKRGELTTQELTE